LDNVYHIKLLTIDAMINMCCYIWTLFHFRCWSV